AERIIGLPRERVRGQRPETVVTQAFDAGGRPVPGGELLGDAALNTGELQSGLVARVSRPDGTGVWVSVSSGAVLDAAGRPEGVVSTPSDITGRLEPGRVTRALADEQAALRRTATLVAAEAPPASVFEQVTEEVARLLGTPSASLVRYEADRRVTLVGAWREPGSDINPVGSSFALDGDSVIARVLRTGQEQRIDDY